MGLIAINRKKEEKTDYIYEFDDKDLNNIEIGMDFIDKENQLKCKLKVPLKELFYRYLDWFDLVQELDQSPFANKLQLLASGV